MTNKPGKHSERGVGKKSTASRFKGTWSQGRSTVPVIPIRPERHLIVTEGIRTEPLYFEEIRRRINDVNHGEWVSVKIVGAGANTLSLLNKAKKLAGDAVEGYTHVWVVYDKDSFEDEAFNAVVSNCETVQSKDPTYHAIWSNECFELWYLLHFEYLHAALSRDAYSKKLTAYMMEIGVGEYEKTRKDMFKILESRLPDAIENAKHLEDTNNGKTPAQSQPGTKVHILISELLPYMGRERD